MRKNKVDSQYRRPDLYEFPLELEEGATGTFLAEAKSPICFIARRVFTPEDSRPDPYAALSAPLPHALRGHFERLQEIMAPLYQGAPARRHRFLQEWYVEFRNCLVGSGSGRLKALAHCEWLAQQTEELRSYPNVHALVCGLLPDFLAWVREKVPSYHLHEVLWQVAKADPMEGLTDLQSISKCMRKAFLKEAIDTQGSNHELIALNEACVTAARRAGLPVPKNIEHGGYLGRLALVFKLAIVTEEVDLPEDLSSLIPIFLYPQTDQRRTAAIECGGNRSYLTDYDRIKSAVHGHPVGEPADAGKKWNPVITDAAFDEFRRLYRRASGHGGTVSALLPVALASKLATELLSWGKLRALMGSEKNGTVAGDPTARFLSRWEAIHRLCGLSGISIPPDMRVFFKGAHLMFGPAFRDAFRLENSVTDPWSALHWLVNPIIHEGVRGTAKAWRQSLVLYHMLYLLQLAEPDFAQRIYMPMLRAHQRLAA